ncbi:MAG: SDR family oxidoreductase [bacterium]|jgi:nucleoside-diphosphate-sugar epimerase
MAHYLVTGGAGFIGSNIVHELARRGERVRVLDDFSTGRRENLEGAEADFELVEGSITDFETCRGACEGIDFVLHQAALPSVPRSIIDPVSSTHVNVGGTVNLLHAAVKAGVKRFVFAASSSAYGNTPTLPKHEEMPANPMSPYAVTKLTGEQFCKAFFYCYGLETVALRYFNIYGPRQDPYSQYGAVIPIFCRQIIRGQPAPIHGDGRQTRDFTFVADAVEANLLACSAPPTCAGEVINIGASGRTSVLELFEMLRDLLGRPDAQAEFLEPRAGDVRDSYASIDKAKRLIGYEPRYDIRRGLELAIDYYKRVCG